MSAVPATAATAAPRKRSRRPRARPAIALLLVALLAAGGAYAAVTLTRDSPSGAAHPGQAALLTAATLEAVTAAAGHDVYGVAVPAGTRRRSRAAATARSGPLLTGDAKLGDFRADYLTDRHLPARRRARRRQGRGRRRPAAIHRAARRRRDAVERRAPRERVRGEPGSDLLGGGFSPDPKAARDLVTGGAVAPLR